MPATARKPDSPVVAVSDYLRDTIDDMDDGIAEMTARRNGIAKRLAIIEASDSSPVKRAVADYETRVKDGRPYEDAQPADEVLSEAWKRSNAQ